MQEKTEKPTSRKLKKAKERGDVAKSTELASALILFSALLLLWGCASFFESRLNETFLVVYSSLRDPDLSESSRAFVPLLYPVLLILGGIFLLALFSHIFQTGWIWSWTRSKKGGEVRLVYPVLKLIVVAVIVYVSLMREKPDTHLLLMSSSGQVTFIFKKIYFLLLKISLALLILGMCDFIYQKWKHFKQMHMTPQEVKEEKRETEGDRQTKDKMQR